jgi:hypothetical protein
VTGGIEEVLAIFGQTMREYYPFARIKLGCQVRVVDLKTEARPEVL